MIRWTKEKAQTVAVAMAVLDEMKRRQVPRETACRIVAQRMGITRFQARAACNAARRNGWVDVPTRPIHWFTTREISYMTKRMHDLRAEGWNAWSAAQIVAKELDCSVDSVWARWRQGVKEGRWTDPGPRPLAGWKLTATERSMMGGVGDAGQTERLESSPLLDCVGACRPGVHRAGGRRRDDAADRAHE